LPLPQQSFAEPGPYQGEFEYRGGSPHGGHLSTGGGIGGVDNVGRYFTIGVRARI